MDEKLVLQQSLELIKKDFKLSDELDLSMIEDQFQALEDYLVLHVNRLLDSDFNGLLNALYRIDLSESSVTELLHTSDSANMARSIARAIVEREKQKAITRLRYRPS